MTPPIFSDIEDSRIDGDALVSCLGLGLGSCWFGFIRNHVGGNAILSHNTLADPDAMEVVTNTIAGNLISLQSV